jgi:hypothetical protein
MGGRIQRMKQIISAKLKLHTTPEQFQALRQAQLAYRDALTMSVAMLSRRTK